MDFNDLMVPTRRKGTELAGRSLSEELASDHSRITYSPSFRRLARKAQVFSLEGNAAVRNRVIHSLEVADVGRLIAHAVSTELIKKKEISAELQLPLIYAVECACLVHDIGNPPFGHFGEGAIQHWFGDEEWIAFYEPSKKSKKQLKRMRDLIKDFQQFDGNPQGLRILLRLKRDRDEFSYNLTYTTLLSFLKYSRSSLEEKGDGLLKKAGYFASEQKIVEEMKASIGMPKEARYILAYIMEAADDIAYCISDIEDGIEKKIIREAEFFNELKQEWESETSVGTPFFFAEIPEDGYRDENHFFKFKIKYTQEAIKAAARHFVDQLEELGKGELASLFPKNGLELKAFNSLKMFSRKKLFRSADSENIELAGNQIVLGLLEKFSPLLKCSHEDFEKILESEKDPSVLNGKDLDVEWRLFNRLPKKHVLAYKDQLSEFNDRDEWPEWYFRAHLVVDYISGMTDHYALEQFQLLSGINIFQKI